MFPRVSNLKGVSCSVALLQKLYFSASCKSFEGGLSIYKPKVLDTKSRISSKVRKINMSKKLREEFSKHKGLIPIIACKRREFNFFEGMKYGKFETVPLASKGWLKKGSNGDFFSLYEKYMSPDDLHFGHAHIPKRDENDLRLITSTEDTGNYDNTEIFSVLGVEPGLVEALHRVGVSKPADIQVASIPHILQEKNCVVSAHTGCGKTLAYLIPLVQMVLKHTLYEKGGSTPLNSPRALILTPSRELTYQIYSVLQKLLEGLALKAKVVVGGYGNPEEDLNEPEVIDFLVGSLGTVNKKFATGVLNAERISHVVLDEADQLADDQNYSKVKNLLKRVHIKREHEEDDVNNEYEYGASGAQIILVSATIPLNLERLFEDLVDVNSLERISTSHLHNVLKNAPQLFLKVSKIHKGKTLIDLVEKSHKAKHPVLIFSNTVKTADWVSLQLNECGFHCKNLTSGVPTAIRQHLFEKFQEGEFNILSTTAMTARGLDTVRVKHIINFDFPLYVSEYIHQIGRVGRIGSSRSCSITNIIAHPREIELVQKIELSVRLGEKLNAVNANIPGILRHRSDRQAGNL